MKLRFFYKVQKDGTPVLGSNIRRQRKPIMGKWEEIKKLCCDPLDILCNCEHRYFIQLDSKGEPVDGTLIMRDRFPDMSDDIHYMEIQWNLCCLPANVPTIPTIALTLVVDPNSLVFCGNTIRFIDNVTYVEFVYKLDDDNGVILPEYLDGNGNISITVNLPVGTYSWFSGIS